MAIRTLEDTLLDDDIEGDVDRAFLRRVVQVVQEKLYFLTIHYNPSLACIAVRDLQSSQRAGSVQSLLLTAIFLNNQ